MKTTPVWQSATIWLLQVFAAAIRYGADRPPGDHRVQDYGPWIR